MFTYNKGWLKGDCPLCAKNQKFGVNILQNRTNCFACGVHLKPLDLIIELEGLKTRNEVLLLLNTFQDVDFLENRVEELIQKPVSLPPDFKLLIFGNNLVGKSARKFMSRRGFDIKELSLQGIGYCSKGDYRFRIIIPFYQKGKLIYFNARQFIDIGAKFKNPPIELFGIGKSLLIYNVDALWVYNKIYIVESATNALTLGPKAIGMGGKKLSAYQISMILKSPCKYVIILLDPDAWLEAINLALRLCNHKQVKLIKLPPEKDVNDIGKKATLKLIKETPYSKYYDFYKMKIDYQDAEG